MRRRPLLVSLAALFVLSAPSARGTEWALADERRMAADAASFAPPETLAAAALPSATARDRYDAAVTLTTRLLAWVWKTAGGDASSVTQYPAAKGPYVVRE